MSGSQFNVVQDILTPPENSPSVPFSQATCDPIPGQIDAQWVPVLFDPANPDPANSGCRTNMLIQLIKNWKFVMKLGSNLSGSDVTDSFLHFSPVTFVLPVVGHDVLTTMGAKPNVYPIEQKLTNNRFVWKFCKGLPSQVYFSADYQGVGLHTDMLIFCDDIDIVQPIKL